MGPRATFSNLGFEHLYVGLFGVGEIILTRWRIHTEKSVFTDFEQFFCPYKLYEYPHSNYAL